MGHKGDQGVRHIVHPLLLVAVIALVARLEHVLGHPGKPGDLLHGEAPALHVLCVRLVQAQLGVFHSVVQDGHFKGVVPGVPGKLPAHLVLGLRLGVRVHLDDPGHPGAVLVKFPAIPLGQRIRGHRLPGQVQQAPPPDPVVGLEKQEAQLPGVENPLHPVHVVLVPVQGGLRVLDDAAAVCGECNPLHQPPGLVPPVPDRPESVPKGV